ncbi:hypothetical protein [Qingshengfaniella alkalisoli]|uniref:Uncharacterized protein n=1 Tax=Qingshengfaniella alkalisoli TaxID=2599296 RepID=A0A5B8J3D8_9RHOB|nr:hypothetical protein [Qingshengfaniella alkalisoli]QDY71601.1 hypothetical protein FPZ52_18190 [Qingshengfaniella alkalisoli]
MFASRLGTALKNILLAMLNATLILLALCLLLAWLLVSEVNAVTDDLAQNLISMQPVCNDVQTLTAEVASLRSDLADARDQLGDARPEALDALGQRAEQMEVRLATISRRVDEISEDPSALIENVVNIAAAQFGETMRGLANCTPPAPLPQEL